MKKYPNKWVAADGLSLVLYDATHEGLWKQIEAKKINPADLCIAFMQTDSL